MHTFVYAVEFRGQAEVGPHEIVLGAFARYTLVGYALALLISAFILWVIGRFEGGGLALVVLATVVLAFPAALDGPPRGSFFEHDPSKTGLSRRRPGLGVPGLLAAGGLLVAGVLGYLLSLHFGRDLSPPELGVRVTGVSASRPGHLVRFSVCNCGGQAAAQVRVEGRLGDAGRGGRAQ